MYWRRPLILAAMLTLGPAADVVAQEAALTGSWRGSFAGPGQPLEVVLRLHPQDDRNWGGSLDLPGRGVFDQAASVRVHDDRLHVEVQALGASFSSSRGAAGDTITGLWIQNGGFAALRLVRTSADPVRRRPQEPRRPLPYEEVAVRYASADGTESLAGTLALPTGPGPHPAVLLISGSGPHDRDGAMAGHRPFLVLSDHLVRHGIAVLRADERGVGGSTGRFSTAITPDFAMDALGAVAFLSRHPAIDRRSIGLIGHSEGGMVAPMVAARSPDVAFLVLLAAPGLPMPQVILQQSEAMLRAEGRPEQEIAANVRAAARLTALVEAGLDGADLEANVRIVFRDRLADLPLSPEARDRHVELAVAQFTSPWMQFASRHDPRSDLRRLTDAPVLAINGTLDTQVLAQPNLAGIADALTAAGNRRFVTAELPQLNHLFQTARTGAMSEYGLIDETFAPLALDLISDWIGSIVQDRCCAAGVHPPR